MKTNTTWLKVLLVSFFLCVCADQSAYAQELEAIIHVSDQITSLDPDKILREYVIGETAYCVLMAKGFGVDPAGAVNLTADITLLDPEDKILFEQENFTAVNRTVAKTDTGVVFENSFELEFNNQDPAGMYTVEVLIKDNISGLSDVTIVTLLLFDTVESKQIIMAPVESAEQLDKLWAEYFRSKNPWAVKRIISTLKLNTESLNVENAAIGAAAQWSLESNAKLHPEILEICKDSLKHTKGNLQKLLREIINNIETESKKEIK